MTISDEMVEWHIHFDQAASHAALVSFVSPGLGNGRV